MMNYVIGLLCCFGVLAASASAAAAPKSCDLSVVDACAVKILFFAQNTSAVLNPNEVAWACQQEKMAVECMRQHNEHCVKGLAQGVMKLVYEGATQESDQKCELNGPRNKDYYKYVPCINKNGAKVHKCMTDAAKHVEAASLAPVKERIPQMCCGLQGLQTCTADATKETCDAHHVAYVRSVIQGIAGDLLDTVCSKFKTASTCRSLSPLKAKSTSKYQTIFPPVIAVLQNL